MWPCSSLVFDDGDDDNDGEEDAGDHGGSSYLIKSNFKPGITLTTSSTTTGLTSMITQKPH